MKKIFWIGLFIGVVMVNFDIADGAVKTKVEAASSRASIIKKAMEAVKYKLKDPYSAMFRNVHISSDGAVRGEVNAKNSYGGYVGFKKFYCGGESVTFEDDLLEQVEESRKLHKKMVAGYNEYVKLDTTKAENQERLKRDKLVYSDTTDIGLKASLWLYKRMFMDGW